MKYKILLAYLLIVTILLSCGPSEEKASAQITQIAEQVLATQAAQITPTPTPTLTPTATSLPTIAPPFDPNPGTANVYGRVLWLGQPIKGVDMILSGWVTDGNDKSLEVWHTNTDGEGVFLFADIPEGDGYSYRADIKGSDYDFPEGKVAMDIMDIGVISSADKNINVGYYHLFANDLVLLSPVRDSTLTKPLPSLSWEQYPGASYYYLRLIQSAGNYTNLDFKTTETQVNLESPLMQCKYGWSVTAYNDSGIPLARSDVGAVFDENMAGIFTIQNDSLYSCYINVIHPSDGAQLSSGRNVEFTWELHPLATEYRFQLYRDKKVNFRGTWIEGLDMVSVIDERLDIQEEGIYTYTVPSLQKGSYQWSVFAYTEGGKQVARTPGDYWVWGIYHFNIK